MKSINEWGEYNISEKAKSQDQQQAAGAALSAKRGETPKYKLKGAAKSMYKMSEKELEKIAGTKHKGLPVKKKTKVQEKLERLVELMAKKYMSENKAQQSQEYNPLQEYGRTIATEVLREVVDDYQLQMELLIDEHYGIDVNQFKKSWYDISNRFEREFSNILKNMSKPR